MSKLSKGKVHRNLTLYALVLLECVYVCARVKVRVKSVYCHMHSWKHISLYNEILPLLPAMSAVQYKISIK